MKIRFLLLGTSLSLIPQTINAQCVATQDCATLGYTETSCAGGSGVKCPFGNKWACFKSESEIKDQLCTELGFTQTCTGTNQTGGVGKACNGKYFDCTCTSGYEWKNGCCQKQVLNGAQSNLYYCNNQVVGVKVLGMGFYVAMNDLGSANWNDARYNCATYSFCGNIKGTLPTKEQLRLIYNNKSTINNLLLTNNGTRIIESWHWSSTNAASKNRHYIVSMHEGYEDDEDDNMPAIVRPILSSY